jgi:hypothetical protein
MKRVDADSSWMVTLCRYLAVGVQLSVLMLEQALYRKPAALEAPEAADGTQVSNRGKQEQRQAQLIADLAEEMREKRLLTPVSGRGLESPWDAKIKTSDPEPILCEYERGITMSKQYIVERLLGGGGRPPAWTGVPSIDKRPPTASKQKKLAKERADEIGVLKSQLDRLEQTAQNPSAILADFAACPYPAALCSPEGMKHSSGKADVNVAMAKELTEAQLARHRADKWPAGTYVVSIDMLIKLYVPPAGSLQTWAQYCERFWSTTVIAVLERTNSMGVVVSFDKREYVVKEKASEQAARRKVQEQQGVPSRYRRKVQDAAYNIEEHVGDPLPSAADWPALCSNHTFREKLIRFLCAAGIDQIKECKPIQRKQVILDGHCMQTLADGTALTKDTPVCIKVGGARRQQPDVHVDGGLKNRIGESDAAVLYLGEQVAARVSANNLILQSSDTDVWLLTLAQLYDDTDTSKFSGIGVYVHRPASGDTVDIKQTKEVLKEKGIPVVEFVFLFCLAGTDFTSGIGGQRHRACLQHYIKHRGTSGNKIPPLVTVECGQVVVNEDAYLRFLASLYFEIPKVKGGESRVNFAGQSLEELFQANTPASVYRMIKAKVQGKEKLAHKTMASYTAMERHALRAEWVLRYWLSIGTTPIAQVKETGLAHRSSTYAAASGARGWKRVDLANPAGPEDSAAELQVEWDVGVWRAGGTGCTCSTTAANGQCAGNCGCKRLERACGPYCGCTGGPNCCQEHTKTYREKLRMDEQSSAQMAARAAAAASRVASRRPAAAAAAPGVAAAAGTVLSIEEQQAAYEAERDDDGWEQAELTEEETAEDQEVAHDLASAPEAGPSAVAASVAAETGADVSGGADSDGEDEGEDSEGDDDVEGHGDAHPFFPGRAAPHDPARNRPTAARLRRSSRAR